MKFAKKMDKISSKLCSGPLLGGPAHDLFTVCPRRQITRPVSTVYLCALHCGPASHNPRPTGQNRPRSLDVGCNPMVDPSPRWNKISCAPIRPNPSRISLSPSCLSFLLRMAVTGSSSRRRPCRTTTTTLRTTAEAFPPPSPPIPFSPRPHHAREEMAASRRL
jgi:hypothetical protein